MKRIAVIVLSLLLAWPAAQAQEGGTAAPFAYRQLDDPAKEAQARELMHSLRCLQCQSQSIADSDAQIAGDMRHQVRLRIAEGDSPDDVRAWMMQRYGDYISYKPVIGRLTWPLFAVPLLLMAGAMAVLWNRFRRTNHTAS